MIFVETMIPVNYNDGTKIPQTIIDNCLFAIAQEFGGYTLSSIGEGFWVGPGGRNFVEPMRRLSVACDVSAVNIIKNMVRGIGIELKQHEMYFIVHTPSIELLKV